jgi:aspartyl aminopeptidase
MHTEKETAKKTAEGLLRFIEKSPTAFHAVREFSEMLKDAGFLELSEGTQWELLPGRGYFVTRNGSSVIAFRLPEEHAGNAGPPAGFQIMAGHSDSPSFKIKENPEIRVENVYIKLNVEKYGGMLFAPWFDRPLSAAGRIIVERDGRLYSRLVDVDRDLLLIPNVAIHMNRKVNEGFAYDPQKDLLPLYGMCGEGKSFLSAVAEAAGEKEEDLRGMDLFLYNRQ